MGALRIAEYLALRKVSKYGVFSGPHFPAFELKTEIYGVSLRIQSEHGKIRTRKDSILGQFSRSVGWSFLHKLRTVFNYFLKKTQSWMFEQILNLPLNLLDVNQLLCIIFVFTNVNIAEKLIDKQVSKARTIAETSSITHINHLQSFLSNIFWNIPNYPNVTLGACSQLLS